MPKKKKQSRKTTQYQRQSVTVNIGTATKRKRKGGGGGGGGHRQNLAPTFITAPQVDFTPLLAMLTHQTRSLQPEPFQNPVTPLSSVTQVLPAEQMAGEAAIRRAGPTAGSFEPVSHMEREISATTQAREALSEILKAQGPRMGFSNEPVQAVPKRGRPFSDMSRLAQAEPVEDPLAVRQTAKTDLAGTFAVGTRPPPTRRKSIAIGERVSFTPTQPPKLTRSVNAAEESFVPQTGRLGSDSSDSDRLLSISESEEEKQKSRRFTIKKQGTLTEQEKSFYTSWQRRKKRGDTIPEKKERTLKIIESKMTKGRTV